MATTDDCTSRILELIETGTTDLPAIYSALRREGWDEVQRGQFDFTNTIKGLGFTVTARDNREQISL